MSWILMVVSAIAGGVATWLWSVRTVRRQVPVYESAPAATEGLAATDDVPMEAVPAADAEATVDDSVSGELEEAGPARGTRGRRALVEAPVRKRKPRTKKKPAPKHAVVEPGDDVAVATPTEAPTLVGDPTTPQK